MEFVLVGHANWIKSGLCYKDLNNFLKTCQGNYKSKNTVARIFLNIRI
jgi:hypothetical protein